MYWLWCIHHMVYGLLGFFSVVLNLALVVLLGVQLYF